MGVSRYSHGHPLNTKLYHLKKASDLLTTTVELYLIVVG